MKNVKLNSTTVIKDGILIVDAVWTDIEEEARIEIDLEKLIQHMAWSAFAKGKFSLVNGIAVSIKGRGQTAAKKLETFRTKLSAKRTSLSKQRDADQHARYLADWAERRAAEQASK